MTLLVANNNNDNFIVSVVYISTIRTGQETIVKLVFP